MLSSFACSSSQRIILQFKLIVRINLKRQRRRRNLTKEFSKRKTVERHNYQCYNLFKFVHYNPACFLRNHRSFLHNRPENSRIIFDFFPHPIRWPVYQACFSQL